MRVQSVPFIGFRREKISVIGEASGLMREFNGFYSYVIDKVFRYTKYRGERSRCSGVARN